MHAEFFQKFCRDALAGLTGPPNPTMKDDEGHDKENPQTQEFFFFLMSQTAGSLGLLFLWLL